MLAYGRYATEAVHGRRYEEFDSNPVLCAAIERFLEIIGEAASRVSDTTQQQIPDVPWHAIVGMRNRLIHGYGDVDRLIVWKTVTENLPSFARQVEAFLDAQQEARD